MDDLSSCPFLLVFSAIGPNRQKGGVVAELVGDN
jgi:hypothetical protein